jgi:hypothetical protein
LKRRRRRLFYLVQAASLAASLAWTLATRDPSLTGLIGPLLASLADDIALALAPLLARLL